MFSTPRTGSNIGIQVISRHKHQHANPLPPNISHNAPPAHNPPSPPPRRPRHPTPHLPHPARRLPGQQLRRHQLIHVPIKRALLLAVRLLRLDRELLPDDGGLPDAVLQLVERVLRAQTRRVHLGRRHVRLYGRGQERVSVSREYNGCELLFRCVRVITIVLRERRW